MSSYVQLSADSKKHEKMTAIDRRNAIIEVLCERRRENLKNLAFEFGVSRRTIANDILELTRSYPIETYRGNGGCVKIADGYYPGRKYLKPKQREALLNAINTADAETRVGLESILREFSI